MKSVLTICTECVYTVLNSIVIRCPQCRYVERLDFNSDNATSRQMTGFRAWGLADTHRRITGHSCGFVYKER